MTLSTHGLSLGYGSTTVVDRLDLTLPRGRLTVIIGPNGCGKSTILRGMAHLIPNRGGHVDIDGQRVDSLGRKELARRLAVLPQTPVTPAGIAVKELVARGRHPHQGFLATWTAHDEAVVTSALAAVDLTGLAEAPVEELSGGQRQRAWIALVLAQETSHVLLDEPTTYLDLAHAVEVMDVIHRAAHLDGKTVIAVQHDLTLASRYADHLVVVSEGRVVAQGPPNIVVTPELLAEVFGLAARVIDVDGAPVVVPPGANVTVTV